MFWPAGSVIRRYFEPRRAKNAGVTNSPKTSGQQVFCHGACEDLSAPSLIAETKGPTGRDKCA